MALTATGALDKPVVPDVAIGAPLVDATTASVPVACVTVTGLNPLPKKPPWWWWRGKP